MHRIVSLTLVAALLVVVCCDQGRSTSSLPDAVLHHLLYAEPNFQLQQLGNVSDLEGGSLKRTFLHSGHRRAALLIQRWMVEAGMTSWIDAVGNVRGRAPSARPASAALLTGSHYDTVIDGGKFDGALGIVAGIAAVKASLLEAAVAGGALSPATLSDAVAALGSGGGGGRLDVRQLLAAAGAAASLPRPVEVAAFSDEEGVRFQSTFLGSRALAGSLLGSGLLGSRDGDGLTLAQALTEAGMDSSAEGLQAASLLPSQLTAYVELHMEQGPVLQAAGRRLGAVTAIAGQTRLHVAVVGVQGHAGTVPMALRRDPLTAAAEVILHLERTCRTDPPANVSSDSGGGGGGAPSDSATRFEAAAAAAAADANGAQSGAAAAAPPVTESLVEEDGSSLVGSSLLVCTVGQVSVWPNAPNVIPGSVNFTVDIRTRWDRQREVVVAALLTHGEAACARRGVSCVFEVRHEAAAVQSAGEVVAGLVNAVEESTATFDRVAARQRQLERPAARGQHAHGKGTCIAADEGAAAAGPVAGSWAGFWAGIWAAALGRAAGPSLCRSPGRSPAADDASAHAPVPLLVSGAGHDAMALANVTRMGMLFVRCKDGISHSPLEYVAPDDVAAGVAALHSFISSWAAQQAES